MPPATLSTPLPVDPFLPEMVGGRGVVLARESAVVEPELFVAVDLDAGRPGERSEALVRLASGVEREWLPEELVTETDEVVCDADRERVVACRVTRYENLELERREVPAEPEEAGRVLAQAARAAPERALARGPPGGPPGAPAVGWTWAQRRAPPSKEPGGPRPTLHSLFPSREP